MRLTPVHIAGGGVARQPGRNAVDEKERRAARQRRGARRGCLGLRRRSCGRRARRRRNGLHTPHCRPADHRRRHPPRLGACLRCRSALLPGKHSPRCVPATPAAAAVDVGPLSAGCMRADGALAERRARLQRSGKRNQQRLAPQQPAAGAAAARAVAGGLGCARLGADEGRWLVSPGGDVCCAADRSCTGVLGKRAAAVARGPGG